MKSSPSTMAVPHPKLPVPINREVCDYTDNGYNDDLGDDSDFGDGDEVLNLELWLWKSFESKEEEIKSTCCLSTDMEGSQEVYEVAVASAGKPFFPGKSVVHQLELITDLLGTPSSDTISRVRDDKARKYSTDMQRKNLVTFAGKFLDVDPLALRLLQRLLAFDSKD
ncbi:Protein kinase-like domain-containing protein [Cynara cardunculus var. scolymus]|uniref:Protein kinase-like domain-containing protein n=1 Tax=Cynara cardunculus var. scolymus TaxID=59895 RepID=A0A103X675_CYNCS|nr:Protein kinase-like domain-containing protein [Cynara cardunculus var. scolymus]